MVWPILISVGVTPRMSAASAGQISTASALTTPNPPTQRIGLPSRILSHLGTLLLRPTAGAVGSALAP
jgi:hypothetical protein